MRERRGAKPPGTARESSNSLCLSTDPEASTAPTRPGLSDQPATVAAKQDSNWSSLIEIHEPESLADCRTTTVERSHNSRWVWSCAAAALVVAGLAGIFARGQFKTKSSRGCADPIGRIRRSGELAEAHDEIAREPSAPNAATKRREFAGVTNDPENAVVSKDDKRMNGEVPANAYHKQETASSRDQSPATTNPRETEPGSTEKVDIGQPGTVDIRQILSRPGVKRLADPLAVPPTEAFWPPALSRTTSKTGRSATLCI